MHSVVEMCDLNDLDRTINLVTAVVESIRDADDFAHRL
jgi:putative aminopeptidase FrvX